MEIHYTDSLTNLLNEVTLRVKENFGHLTPEQLNWKPAPNRWSIAQCLDHLSVSNKTYFPEFERMAKQIPFDNFWGKIPFLSGLFGKMLLKSIHPDSKPRLKAPSKFVPSKSNLPETVLTDFELTQQELINHYQALKSVSNHESLKMTSPASGFVTYFLKDCLNLLVLHEQRHLNQAIRVMHSPDFPANPV